jgi:hypothetical protein
MSTPRSFSNMRVIICGEKLSILAASATVYAGLTRLELEARVGIEPTHKGFADLSLTTWVPRPCLNTLAFRVKKVHPRKDRTRNSGAGDGGRTRDIDLGKVALYH